MAFKKEQEKTLAELQMEQSGLSITSLMQKDTLEALELKTSLKKFTCKMFEAANKRPFVLSWHHLRLFDALQDVVDGKCKRLIINMPPRYGKTEVVVKSFTAWCYALNPLCRFLHLSYSDRLVYGNSDTIRETMKLPEYKRLFPDSELASEKGSSKQWKTKAGGEFYAVSSQGQVTGFGAGNVDNPDADETGEPITGIFEIDNVLHQMGAMTNVFQGAIIIDDPLKPDDAESELVRERINFRFENTIRSRVNSRETPIIIIMQRLHEHDLCGYLEELEPEEWRVLSLPALFTNEKGEEEALWPFKHSVKELQALRENDPVVFDTQYCQDPKPREGLMYSTGFQTYQPETLPALLKSSPGTRSRRCNYTDTADTGSDSLCSICFVDTPSFVYVTDVYFTDAAMEVTEPKTAEMLAMNATQEALIESNNGGRGFARQVKTILRTQYRGCMCAVNSFTQTQNKKTRINTNSALAQNDVLFPTDWQRRWPKFYAALMSYRKDNKKKNQHDDAPDALTGVVEMHLRKCKSVKIRRRN